MAKYVIDTDNCPFKIRTLLAMGWKEEDGLERFKTIGDDEVELLNSDYINEHYGDLQDIAYQAGLEDAWELMHKIAFYKDPHVLIDAFGATTWGELLENNTPQEAIAKLRAYEEKQDEIKIGDEVTPKSKDADWKGIVIGIEGGEAQVMTPDGYSCGYPLDIMKRTGRHFPEVADLLKKMKGE